jgi:hypothetical protein
MDKMIAVAGIAASLLAAGLWLWASLIFVPDDILTIAAKLQRVGRINSGAAFAAVVAALCAAITFWRSLPV